MKPRWILALLASLTIASPAALVAQTMELRSAMQDMGQNMQTAVDAISRQDWSRVAQAAARIVKHPQPSDAEKARIIGFFAAEMGRFKAIDSQTGEAAAELERVAVAGKGSEVINAFARVQTACLNCHEAFRDRFLSRFYLPDGKTLRAD